MTVYVESNYLLELAFEQEQHGECKELLGLAEGGRVTLVFPAYAVGECLDRVHRRREGRRIIQDDLRGEIRELRRSAGTASFADQLRMLIDFTVTLAVSDQTTCDAYLRRLLACATLIPLDAAVIRQSLDARTAYDLTPQDALILASVLAHLAATAPATSLFFNKNSKDFGKPDIVTALAQSGCQLKFDFRAGLAYLNANLPPPP